MSAPRRSTIQAAVLSALALTLSATGCDQTATEAAPGGPAGPSFTLASGSQGTLLGRANFADPSNPTLKVKRITGDWHTEVKATPSLDIAVQRIVFQPGGQSGWHRHPGPVFIQVVTGTMTFYSSDDPTCAPTVRSAGQGFLDVGDHAHIARNETGATAENIVVYLAPPGAALRIDAPDPGNCPF